MNWNCCLKSCNRFFYKLKDKETNLDGVLEAHNKYIEECIFEKIKSMENEMFCWNVWATDQFYHFN
ncbi:hypothetical protein COK72_12145 [Bacillus thuringiensis]|uniref:Uncharacterized protein n=1 Tax=Bacillus thuringiensis TaxID=1428 RepID=A0A9X7ANY7_BACTU|nr:hypothetical protein COK72_12145 [Bacillus thuringiensis]